MNTISKQLDTQHFLQIEWRSRSAPLLVKSVDTKDGHCDSMDDRSGDTFQNGSHWQSIEKRDWNCDFRQSTCNFSTSMVEQTPDGLRPMSDNRTSNMYLGYVTANGIHRNAAICVTVIYKLMADKSDIFNFKIFTDRNGNNDWMGHDVVHRENQLAGGKKSCLNLI